MCKTLARYAVACALSLIAFPAMAQSAAPPDPRDPSASVPPTRYKSSFSGVRPFTEEPIGDWKAANDNVERIGGWRTYLKESRTPDAPTPNAPASTVPAQPPAPAAKPSAPAHKH